MCWFLIGSRAHIRLTCLKQGRIVRKPVPVNANPDLKVNQITFSPIQMFFDGFVYMVIIKTENRRPNNI